MGGTTEPCLREPGLTSTELPFFDRSPIAKLSLPVIIVSGMAIRTYDVTSIEHGSEPAVGRPSRSSRRRLGRVHARATAELVEAWARAGVGILEAPTAGEREPRMPHARTVRHSRCRRAPIHKVPGICPFVTLHLSGRCCRPSVPKEGGSGGDNPRF